MWGGFTSTALISHRLWRITRISPWIRFIDPRANVRSGSSTGPFNQANICCAFHHWAKYTAKENTMKSEKSKGLTSESPLQVVSGVDSLPSVGGSYSGREM